MATIAYERESTALLVVDPYNDFISEAARYGIAFALSPRRMSAFRICCRC